MSSSKRCFDTITQVFINLKVQKIHQFLKEKQVSSDNKVSHMSYPDKMYTDIKAIF